LLHFLGFFVFHSQVDVIGPVTELIDNIDNDGVF